jgi:nucleotide-binding universal stress UspA family protein
MSVIFVAEELRVPLFTDTGLMSVTTLKLDEEIVARADEALRQLDDETGESAVETRYVVRHGSPAREIVAVAEDADVDLIVVGRRGHSIHEGVLLGTVTEHVVRRSKCPVLTIVPGT